MDLYVLDGAYRRTELIDNYESLIWTERFRSFGEFQLVLASTTENRERLKAGTWLAIPDSVRTMKVETTEVKEMGTGESQLIVKGRSLETFLDGRQAIKLGTGGVGSMLPQWVITDVPGDIARKIFNDVCILGTVTPNDILTMAVNGSPVGMFPPDTIPESADVVTMTFDPKSVYAALVEICDVYDLGFRLVREPDEPYLYFDVYSGCDRTSAQSVYPPVLFSSSLDNLFDTTEFRSIASFKNVAIAYSKEWVKAVDADEFSVGSPTGLDRETILISVDIPEGTTWAVAEPILIQKAREELAKHRIFDGFDGEVDQHSQYKYGVDYHLGDLVEMRSSSGAANQMRVSEQIFASDAEGTRSYPTLAIDRYIQPGTWLSWDYNQVWQDLDPDPTTWSEQP